PPLRPRPPAGRDAAPRGPGGPLLHRPAGAPDRPHRGPAADRRHRRAQLRPRATLRQPAPGRGLPGHARPPAGTQRDRLGAPPHGHPYHGVLARTQARAPAPRGAGERRVLVKLNPPRTLERDEQSSEKPTPGLEPGTPSLPWKCSTD